MRNVLDRSCRENRSTHFMFNNYFPVNGAVYKIMSKNVMETVGTQMTSQHGAYALQARLARLQASMRTPTRLSTQMHVSAPARACVRARTLLLLFQGKNDSRTRLSVTLYVHCPSCLFYILGSGM
jgi:hypothetical protein